MSLGSLLEDATGINAPHKYYGKYRGDGAPQRGSAQHRRASPPMVPDVSALMADHVGAAVSARRRHSVRVCVIPPMGAGVWIEFEQGDPDYPIWTGGFWGSAAEVPPFVRQRLPVSPESLCRRSG
jgi:hypothetical protein